MSFLSFIVIIITYFFVGSIIAGLLLKFKLIEEDRDLTEGTNIFLWVILYPILIPSYIALFFINKIINFIKNI